MCLLFDVFLCFLSSTAIQQSLNPSPAPTPAAAAGSAVQPATTTAAPETAAAAAAAAAASAAEPAQPRVYKNKAEAQAAFKALLTELVGRCYSCHCFFVAGLC